MGTRPKEDVPVNPVMLRFMRFGAVHPDLLGVIDVAWPHYHYFSRPHTGQLLNLDHGVNLWGHLCQHGIDVLLRYRLHRARFPCP